MNFRNISAWSIRNPLLPILLFCGLVLAGLTSFHNMEVQNQPDIEFPVVIVSISEPGAAPTEIENQITQRVESAVQTIDGVKTITSTASEGVSQTVVEFQLGTDINEDVNEVKDQIDQIRDNLPNDILEPRISKRATSSRPIAYFAINSSNMTMEQLSWFVDDVVVKRLLTVPGLAQATRIGGVDREILVILHPARMQALGVTADEVNAALRKANVNAGGGETQIAGSRQAVRVLGNAESAYQLSQTQVSLGNGQTVKLADIADVKDSYGEQSTVAKIHGHQVVTFSISRARGASDVSVYNGATKVLHQIEKQNPGVSFTRVYSEVGYTELQYQSSMAAIVEGALLAVVVVFLFLRDWRATIISALAIPLSAIPTFYFMHLLGFSLNNMSLLALGLVAGVLVDDAIVEIENIVRHMRMGKSAYQAAIDAADEIGLAVVSTTFCIVAVFLPVGLMPGITGQFFKNFGLTVVAAVLMSLTVARLITPMIAAYFLKARGHMSHGEGRAMDLYMKVLEWSLDTSAFRAARARTGKVFTRAQYHLAAIATGAVVLGALGWAMGMLGGGHGSGGGGPSPWLILPALLACYCVGGVLNFALALAWGRIAGWDRHPITERAHYLALRFLDHRVWMILGGVGALVLSIIIGFTIPVQFFPDANSDFAMVQVDMAPGTTLEQTEAVVDRIGRHLSQQPSVALALDVSNKGSGYIRIVLKKDRQLTSKQFQEKLTPWLATIPDARINFQGSGPGAGQGTGRDITIMLTGSDPGQLSQTADRLVSEMETVPGVVAPRIDQDLQRPELIIKPREDLAASLGVSTSALSQAIRIATLGEIDQNAAKFSLSDRQIPIRVRLSKNSRANFAAIENLPVPVAGGGSVPLRRVADISFGTGPTTIERYDQNRRVFVGADVAPGYARGNVMSAIDKLPVMRNLPSGISSPPVGADQFQQEMISSFTVALITGILMVFAVLVLLYHRIISPLVNMSSLFLAPLGGLLLMLIIGMPLSLPVFIGILMLLGIVAKNSILLIDFAIEEMGKGTGKRKAIIEAGHKRAQPIVMTTVAMTAGMLPSALSLSGDDSLRAPMGVMVIGGLLLSTLLTLLIVPAGFSLADGLEKRVGPWLRKRILTYDPDDPLHRRPEATPAE